MTIVQQLLFNIPTGILGLIIIGGTVAFSMGGLLVVRHFAPYFRLKAHHDVADPVIGVLGALYSVLLAFVTVTVWQNFEKSNANVQLEAIYLADVYRDAEAFSPGFRQKINNLLVEYRQAVVKYEWKTMSKGEMSPEVERLIRQIWTLYTTYQPRTSTEQSFFNESVSKLNLFRELRRQRIMDSKNGIPILLYVVLIAGGAITIGFTFLFGVENLKAQIVMVVMLSAIISLVIFTIMQLDYPFTGDISISAAPFKEILLD